MSEQPFHGQLKLSEPRTAIHCFIESASGNASIHGSGGSRQVSIVSVETPFWQT